MPETDTTTTSTATDGEPVKPAAPTRGPGTDGNKKIVDMSADEKADYFSHKADRLAGILSGYGDVTPEQLADLQDKANKHDALEHELMSDRDKAIEEATNKATTEASNKLLPRLAEAELRAAAAVKGVASEKLAAALKYVDKTLFFKPGGDVDSDKVAEFVDGIAPAPVGKKGPSSFGLGAREPSSASSGEQGRQQAAKRFGAKK